MFIKDFIHVVYHFKSHVKAKQEVSGSLSLEEIEGRGKPSSVINNAIDNQNGALDNRAFNSLLLSMKNAGQLPEKPSPIVCNNFNY